MRISDWSSDVCSSDLSPPPPPEIAIPQPRVFPESITATRDGTLIVASAGNGTIWRARPGDKAAPFFIEPDSSGHSSVLGVFARSEERFVGKECVCMFKSRWSSATTQKKDNILIHRNGTNSILLYKH